VTRSPRPSPSVFAYCKRSNTGGGNGLGTRLGQAHHVLYRTCALTLVSRAQTQPPTGRVWYTYVDEFVLNINTY